MSAQDHIDKIGRAIVEVERLSNETKLAAKATERAVVKLHELLDDAQTAYEAEHGNVVRFTGGTNKPPTD